MFVHSLLWNVGNNDNNNALCNSEKFKIRFNRFGQSTARYATFLAVGVILAEMGTNSLTDSLWESNNKGKTYKQVDWSKFDPQDDEEEDDDDDDDDDDDEDDDE